MKIYIETLGCPKNFSDSETAAAILEKAGHEIIEDPGKADAVMINTCGFIEDAKVESIDRIFDFIREKRKDMILIVSGCLAQRYADSLFEEMPEVDIFTGVNEYERLPEMLEKFKREGRQSENRPYDPALDSNVSDERRLSGNVSTSYLRIAEGCDNSCAYCIIPAIRGPYRSRRQENIIREAEMLAAKGCRELILIAQDTTAYGKDLYGEYKLAELLRKLCRIEGIRWIRLLYCYEERITDELIEVMASEEKICHYIDIPLQHANDRILKAMGRRSTKASITGTIAKLRERIPDICIRTTLIAGLPGETEEEFDELLDFVGEMRFDRLGAFAYSREEGTRAAEMDGQVDEKIKQERKDALMRLQNEISLEKNNEKKGKTLEVITERKEEDGTYTGRTRADAPDIDNEVIFTSRRELQPGEMVQVLITDAFDYDITGMEVNDESAE
ncbi:MAG: 30S ribosomal protein S12 methylthiotransferase RimO [Bacillota bacterium]|nr:30S ribosomal protein S12 methylthiotransferase RimO [Bacillota bacterium]